MKIQTNTKAAIMKNPSFDAIIGEGSFNSQGFAVRTSVVAGGCGGVNDGCPSGVGRDKLGNCTVTCPSGNEGADRP